VGGKHCVRNRFFRRQLIFIRLGRGEIPNGAQHRHHPPHPPGEAGIDLIFGSATGGSSYVRGWIFFSTWPWWVGGRRARVPEATGVDLFRVWRGRRGGSLQCSRPLKEPAERGGRTSEATGIDLFDLAVGRRRRDAQRNGLGDAHRMSPLKGRTARCF